MKYLKVNGHCDVPSDYVVKYAASTRELKLGQWSRVQFRRLKNNQLSSYKATKLRGLLEEAALLRQKRRMEEWSLYYSLFLTFGSTRGYYDVPLPFVCVNPQSGTIYPLGKWLREQQQAYLAKKLPAALAQLFQKFVDEGSFCWEFESAESSGEKNLREERPQKKPRS